MALTDEAKGGAPPGAALRASQGGEGPVAGRGGPLDRRLVRRARATRWYLAAGVAIGCATAALTVTQAWALSRGIATAFGALTGDASWVVPALLGVFGGKAVLTWLNTVLAQRAAAAVKSQLRGDILRARLARPLDAGTSTAGLVTLFTQGLDALDGYYARYLPQLLLAVTVPLVVGVAIATSDLGSVLIVALTLPLIPVFMALVGWTTEARTTRRWALQQRLARHFGDLVAGLPTLQVFGRARAQAIGLRRTEEAHRAETMATLRISFLSALVLELLATLSVAVVAVTVGFRVVYGQLDLATALFVLVLAPEAYLPVRQVGVHYHDSADGVAAAQQAFALIDGSADGPERAGAFTGEASPAGLLSVRGLAHTYPGSDIPAVSGVSFDVAPGEFVVLTGPSGGGKTTVLHALMGFLVPTAGSLLAGTGDASTWRRRTAYVGQEPGMVSGTVADNVRLGTPAASAAVLREALDRAGARDVSLGRTVGDDGEGLSAGERRRVATARALVRIAAGAADLLVLDEPTAGLDADAEASLLAGVRDLGVAVVVVSHRPAVIARADTVVRIGDDT